MFIENPNNIATDPFLDETLLEKENELEYMNTLLPYNPFSFKNVSYQLKLSKYSLETTNEKLSGTPIFQGILDLGKSSLTIGRGEKNDWVFEVLEVSREHARIFLEFDKVYLTNSSKKNPVFYGLQLDHEYILNDRDEIRIGLYFMRFMISKDKVQYTIFHSENDSNSIIEEVTWQSGTFNIGKHLFKNQRRILENHGKLTYDKYQGVIKISVNESFNTFLSLQNTDSSKEKKLEIGKNQYLYFGESLYELTCDQN